MFYFIMKSFWIFVFVFSLLLDLDVLVKYEVFYLVIVIIELIFWECVGNIFVDSILILICV